MKARKIFIIGFLLVVPSLSEATLALNYHSCYPPDTTGPVLSVSRNTIVVYDDYEHENKEFFYAGGFEGYRPGDMVRIYWRCRPFHIIKMSTPAYDSHTRNLGYIQKE